MSFLFGVMVGSLFTIFILAICSAGGKDDKEK